MAQVLIRHKIADFEKWKAAFDSSVGIRKSNGEVSSRIFIDAGDNTMMTGIFEWDTMENAKKFLGSELIKKKMMEAGVVGEVHTHFLEEVK
jgi:antibiotic biosynthesis monooxygenase (ABM) superfamily enzyme